MKSTLENQYGNNNGIKYDFLKKNSKLNRLTKNKKEDTIINVRNERRDIPGMLFRL